jgi:hypothetical protein
MLLKPLALPGLSRAESVRKQTALRLYRNDLLPLGENDYEVGSFGG